VFAGTAAETVTVFPTGSKHVKVKTVAVPPAVTKIPLFIGLTAADANTFALLK